MLTPVIHVNAEFRINVEASRSDRGKTGEARHHMKTDAGLFVSF